MNIKDLILKQCRHNAWANRRIIEWLGGKPREEISRKVPSSFAGILPTLLHLARVQEFWLAVLSGAEADSSVSPDDFAAVAQKLSETSEKLAALAASLDESSFSEQVFFRAPNIGEVSQSRADLYTQCLTHNIYHRGQIVSVGRALGFADAPMTDYIFYLFTRNSAS